MAETVAGFAYFGFSVLARNRLSAEWYFQTPKPNRNDIRLPTTENISMCLTTSTLHRLCTLNVRIGSFPGTEARGSCSCFLAGDWNRKLNRAAQYRELSFWEYEIFILHYWTILLHKPTAGDCSKKRLLSLNYLVCILATRGPHDLKLCSVRKVKI